MRHINNRASEAGIKGKVRQKKETKKWKGEWDKKEVKKLYAESNKNCYTFTCKDFDLSTWPKRFSENLSWSFSQESLISKNRNIRKLFSLVQYLSDCNRKANITFILGVNFF